MASTTTLIKTKCTTKKDSDPGYQRKDLRHLSVAQLRIFRLGAGEVRLRYHTSHQTKHTQKCKADECIADECTAHECTADEYTVDECIADECSCRVVKTAARYLPQDRPSVEKKGSYNAIINTTLDQAVWTMITASGVVLKIFRRTVTFFKDILLYI